MRIIRLCFSGFRNLADGEFVPSGEVNVIYGKNAQGKTNLLEGMWLFTGGRSFRGAKDGEMVSFGKEEGTLHLDFFSEEREQTADIFLRNGKRSAVLNGVEQRSASGLVGKFCAVIFSPEHLSLVKDGPALRRNLIDGAVCQFKPSYARLLYQYNRTLNQRNALLKDIPRHSELLDTLEIWDDRLAKYGREIIRERISYLDQVREISCGIYAGIAKNREKIELSYKYSFPASEGSSLEEAFRKSRREDVAAGFTTVGPHRDDMEIRIDSVSARSFGSQGQQRSIVLALKLAECELLGEKTGEAPVIFLDDVMSELDSERQDYLLNHLEGRQVFITCCEAESVRRLSGGGRFRMEHGALTPN